MELCSSQCTRRAELQPTPPHMDTEVRVCLTSGIQAKVSWNQGEGQSRGSAPKTEYHQAAVPTAPTHPPKLISPRDHNTPNAASKVPSFELHRRSGMMLNYWIVSNSTSQSVACRDPTKWFRDCQRVDKVGTSLQYSQGSPSPLSTCWGFRAPSWPSTAQAPIPPRGHGRECGTIGVEAAALMPPLPHT